ncbi:hypothetical protein FFLO_04752 [Filobasidium floriforme]|uniref:Superoxide dismutase 1 copper chaperone n=1 Tax=Filobasidium floriforme TaxID=5210 RepID=A0A8K0JNN2_9TREE|nr:uncharacterized protein HD553DRAFT_313681 [Filobasidium floriforme]KAG7530845.1 hypothetical protein FFLO_04752 [Filobasidium floriforme]KAH8082544.1 hypothetical protein HD553DRAFT_313681 [Filobasidium floriforme]
MVNEHPQTGSSASTSSVSFKTEFAVDMTCQSCVSAVTKALQTVPGVEDYDINLEKKQVVVTGRAPPSLVTRALKDTGRQILIRGSGTTTGEHEGAAVAIFETPLGPSLGTTTTPNHSQLEETQKVHGIARLVQVSSSPVLSLLDLTIRFPGYPLAAPSLSTSSSLSSSGSTGTPTNSIHTRTSSPDSYTLYISRTGDLTNLHTPPSYSISTPLHTLTTLQPDSEGYADAFLELPFAVWEVVGRGMVVERTGDLEARLQALNLNLKSDVKAKAQEVKEQERMKDVVGIMGGKGRLGILAGVIARSSGVWGNDKTICACSGKTMWEEGRTMDSISQVPV